MKLVQRHWCPKCTLSGGIGMFRDEAGHPHFGIGECPNIEFHKETDIILDED